MKQEAFELASSAGGAVLPWRKGVRRGRRGRSDRRGAKAATRGGAAAFHAIVENRHGSRTLGRRRPRPRRVAALAVPSGEQVRLHRPVD